MELVVGDGDLSFSRSLLESDKVRAECLHIGMYEGGPEEFKNKYKEAGKENLAELEKAGAKIFWGCDATTFSGFPPKQYGAVRWNYPHPAVYTKNMAPSHGRELLGKFLKAAARILKSGDAQV